MSDYGDINAAMDAAAQVGRDDGYEEPRETRVACNRDVLGKGTFPVCAQCYNDLVVSPSPREAAP